MPYYTQLTHTHIYTVEILSLDPWLSPNEFIFVRADQSLLPDFDGVIPQDEWTNQENISTSSHNFRG